MDLVAPGLDIFTTDLGGSYTHKSGTSVAAPMVAGVCALLLSRYPDLSPEQVRDILINTAVKLDGYDFEDGRNDEVGFGMVDAEATLEYNILRPEVYVQHEWVNWHLEYIDETLSSISPIRSKYNNTE